MGASGLCGRVFQRNPDGSVGRGIKDVTIAFISANSRVVTTVKTGRGGSYRVTLAPSKYVAGAGHPEYCGYSTAPGYVVVRPSRFGVFNIFLRRKGATTVLLVRHAEPDYSQGGYDYPLSAEGLLRAEKLVHVASKAGITGIYTTDTNRTRQTVAPLAQALGLTPIIYGYNSNSALAAQLKADHFGEAALVAGHAPTIPEIVIALGGDGASCQYGNEFDRLFVVVAYQSGKAEIAKLQYGEPTP
jgi:phosphohistidine phosphatase SixA